MCFKLKSLKGLQISPNGCIYFDHLIYFKTYKKYNFSKKSLLSKLLHKKKMNSHFTVENTQSFFKTCPLEKIQLYGQELVLVVKPKLLYDTLVFFKYHIPYQFNILTCITGVDHPNNKYRFNLVYDLLSIRFNIRLRIKTFTHELLDIDSCHQLYFTAGWYECEI